MTIAERLRSQNKALKVEELADLLGVAIRTVFKKAEDNRIPFFRVRSPICFDPHQVADWLERKNGRIT
jgi:excisionase family DNA binding protein